MVAVKAHKPYLKGKKRGEYKLIFGYLEVGDYVDVPASDIHRARATLYMMYPSPHERRTLKLNKDWYRVWRGTIFNGESSTNTPATRSRGE